MGILDEAIRDHLDLKLRRGADPAEVARQEGEVFGPPRRVAARDPQDDSDEPQASPEAEVTDDGDLGAAEPAPEPVEARQTHLRLAEPAADEDEIDFAAEDEPFAEDAPAPTVEPEAPAAPQASAEPEGAATAELFEPSPQETRAFDPEEVRAALGAAGDPGVVGEDDRDAEEDEDVLEETPEFLAETPEHDRLWFEQRPPRDFDF